jgi:hypothetical protein
MIQIKRIKNQDNLHYYYFQNTNDTHNELINFLHNAKFDEDSCNEVDTPFLEMNGECLYVKNAKMKIHFFICDNNTWMLIDSDLNQDEILVLMRKNFIFPK